LLVSGISYVLHAGKWEQNGMFVGSLQDQQDTSSNQPGPPWNLRWFVLDFFSRDFFFVVIISCSLPSLNAVSAICCINHAKTETTSFRNYCAS